jgi:hypothetical protein
VIVDKKLREMRIKDVCFVNCDFALFISIYFIIVIIDMIRDNQFMHLSMLINPQRRGRAFICGVFDHQLHPHPGDFD